MAESISIVMPAKNEAVGLNELLPKLNSAFPQAEIIVVNDGSTDNTADVVQAHGAKLIAHPYSLGNGAAIKSGARQASGDILIFMDGDGQHDPADIPRLLEQIDAGYEMAVGARAWDTHASPARKIGNRVYNRLASYMTGNKIDDLTSGFRAVRGRHFRRFLYLFPNGFSYPSTCTMAFFRSGLPVCYVPVRALARAGSSHIRVLKDGARFFMVIIKIGTLFSPMRLFLPISTALFIVGLTYYGYTFSTQHRFTNMSALLLISSVFTFLIGILAELVSSLHYKEADFDRRLVARENSETAAAVSSDKIAQ